MGRFSFSADCFDWRRDEFEAASFGPVGLRHDEMDAESSVDQLLERGHGEAWRAAENEIEGLSHSAIQQLRDRVTKTRRHRISIPQSTQSPNPSISQFLPFSGFHHLADFALHQVALQGADVADVELAVQVIGLVQEGAGQQLFAGFFVDLAVDVLGADGDFVGTR